MQIVAVVLNGLAFLVVLFAVWKLHRLGGFLLNMREPQSTEARQWATTFRIAIAVSIVAGAVFHLG
ncbi:MAG: hypothetical protein AAGI44_14115 [Pseudomonadota bacterium]